MPVSEKTPKVAEAITLIQWGISRIKCSKLPIVVKNRHFFTSKREANKRTFQTFVPSLVKARLSSRAACRQKAAKPTQNADCQNT
jgi:hypothetical protein